MSAVTENSVIVPAPNHCGKACYTLEIARVLSKRTGARIEDVLFSLPRETLYSLKQKGKDASYTMYLRHEVFQRTDKKAGCVSGLTIKNLV